MHTDYTILLVDSDHYHLQLITTLLPYLHDKACFVMYESTLQSAVQRLKLGEINFVILDLNLSDSSDVDTFFQLHEAFPDISIVIIDEPFDIERGIRIIRQGGQDYLPKALLKKDKLFFAHLLRLAIERAQINESVITERNRLRTSALLTDRLATVGTLAAGVAHEINNPISWVLENLSFLKEQVDALKGLVDELKQIAQISNYGKQQNCLNEFFSNKKHEQDMAKFEEVINETLQGAERIRDIVRDLKGFARVDKSESKIVDINSILATAINMAVPEFKFRAQVETHFANDLPPVLASSGKLHQVFLNLIVNAAHAIPEGDIQNNKIILTSRLADDHVQVDITDTGQGIPATILPKIFDPFFTTKSPGSGTGLGLAITHEVISNLGGEIKVTSTPMKGTTFSVFLPIQPNLILPEQKLKEEEIKIIQKRYILVVDDELSLLKTMQRMLENYHSVKTILGGEAAIEILQQASQPFDVIICDLNMPHVSGADLFHFVAEYFPGLEHKMIFITGGVYTSMMKDFLDSIQNPVLEKPFTPKDLLGAIDRITEKTLAPV